MGRIIELTKDRIQEHGKLWKFLGEKNNPVVHLGFKRVAISQAEMVVMYNDFLEERAIRNKRRKNGRTI
jgi:hypothetical protein